MVAQAHLDSLLGRLEREGLQARVESVEPEPGDVGIMGRANEYEGGFVILTISHGS